MLSRIKMIVRFLLPILLQICLVVGHAARPAMAQDAAQWIDTSGRSIDRRASGPEQIVHLPPVSSMESQAGAAPLLAGSIFKPYQAIAMPGAWADAVGIGDFNTDGLNDLAVTDGSNGTGLWLFLQNRDGSLASPVKYAAGSRPETLAVGDLNHDGRADIATGNFGSNTISVYLQKMDGTLSPQVTYLTSTGPDAIAIADLNNDGWDDIAVSHWNAGVLGVFYQQANGLLASMTSYPSPQAGYDDIDTGDFNNDGLTDIVKMNGQLYANPNLSVYLQMPGGGFGNPVSYDLGSINSNGVAAGDVTGDGLEDIALVYGGNRPSSNLAIFAQNTSGTLNSPSTYSSYDIPEPVEVADIDLDGRKDVLTVHGGWDAIGVYLQKADGNLNAEQLYMLPYASHYGPQGVDVGDINGDGGPDVVIGDYNQGLVILYNALVPDFSLAAFPASQVVEAGKTAQVSVAVSGIMGYNIPVSLAAEGLPAGVTADISPNPVTPSGSATLTLSVDPRSGSGVYTLVITGTGGQITRSASVSIEIVQPITGLCAGNDGPTFLGRATQLKATIASGSGVLFHWDFGDGKTGNGATLLHTYSAVGTYKATVTASNATGSFQASTSVEVVDVPIAGLLIYTQNPAEVNTPTAMFAKISAGTNIAYHWEFGDGAGADGAEVSHIYAQSGLYRVKLTAANGAGSVTREVSLWVTNDGTTHLFYIPIILHRRGGWLQASSQPTP